MNRYYSICYIKRKKQRDCKLQISSHLQCLYASNAFRHFSFILS